jgi:hypothetical protein
MNTINLSEFIRLAKHLDKIGDFKKADNLYIKISNYYPEQSQTKTKDINYFEWDETTDEQFKDNNEAYIEKKPNLLQKEYYDLGDGSDPKKKDELNTQALLNGPSGVKGPAAIDPGNLASSPSMSGGVDNFKWDEVYDEDHPEYNRIPRR